MRLSDNIQNVRGVGPAKAKLLEKMGLSTVGDLIDYWPKRYDDYSTPSSVAAIRPGLVVLKGRFSDIKSRYSRRGLHITDGLFTDSSGTVKVVWFNQPYRATSIRQDQTYYISGEYGLHGTSLSIMSPKVELEQSVGEVSSVLAIYKESKNINSAYIRKLFKEISDVFDTIPESLPDWVISSAGLIAKSQALKQLHLPKSNNDLEQAKYRLGFEEVFQMQLAGQLTRLELLKEQSPKINFDLQVAKKFVDNLPFFLTDDQRRTAWQVFKDMDKDTPMNRLVEGDVGSGKTIVAAMAACMVIESGYRVLFMAPTEILARQHAETLSKLLAHTKWSNKIGLLVGSLKPSQKKALHERMASGDCLLAVGTHALIQDKLTASNVALVIIDEQHRFGVDQRTKLRSKAGLFPHVLCLTATPIPRTLALTLYGELDTTQLRSMPEGRKPIQTEIVKPSAREGLYRTIDKNIAEGRQAFIVCPLIEESLDKTYASAEGLYRDLSSKRFKHLKVGLLHGNMKADEKDRVMSSFKSGEINLLISTTVIEVGVDVPNASVMVVESAERFGLAQIHQLRGRVGRGEHQGFCYLVPSEDSLITKRLKALTYINDGFRLSEIDLELRGPGSIYGLRQSGMLDLRLANLSDDKLINLAKKYAVEFVERGEKLIKYEQLATKVNHFRSVSRLN